MNGKRYVFTSGHKVIGVSSIDLVNAHKYRTNKIVTSISKIKNSATTKPRTKYHSRNSNSIGNRNGNRNRNGSIEDAKRKLEKSLSSSEDTGVQAIGTGIRGVRYGNRILSDLYKIGKGAAPKTSISLSDGKMRVYQVNNKIYTVSRGLTSGTIALDKSTISKIREQSLKKTEGKILKTGREIKRLPEAERGIRVGVSVTKDKRFSVGSIGRPVRTVAGSGINEISHRLSNDGDIGGQSIVAAKDFVKYGYRSLKTATKGTYRVGRTTVNATKATYRFSKQAYKEGLKNTTKKAFKKIQKKITDKIKTLLLNLVKKLIFNPYTMAALIALIGFSATIVGGGAVAAIIPGGVIQKVDEVAEGLRGIYDRVKDTISNVAGWILGNDPDLDIKELSVEEYLLEASALYREDIINSIYAAQQDYLDSDYHVIKINNLYGAEARAELAAVDREFISNSVISAEDIVDIIMPLWNSIMLGTYGGRATASEMNSLTEELNHMITDFEVLETLVERCDGNIDICLNHTEKQYHEAYSGLSCCVTSRYYCPDGALNNCTNILVTEIPVWEMIDEELVQVGTIEVEYCGGHTDFYCNGYTECLGHNIVVFTLGNKSIDELMQIYFLDRIDELNSKSSLTDEEKNELITLEQYYQFALGLFEIYKQ